MRLAPAHWCGLSPSSRPLMRPFTAVGATVLLAAISACSDGITAPTSERTPTTVRWNDLARELVIADRAAPPIASRVYAYLSVAQYAAALTARGFVPFDASTVLSPTPGLAEAAVSSASAGVLAFMFPSHALTINAALATDRAELQRRGVTILDRAAAIASEIVQALEIRARADGSNTRWTGVVPNGAGYWVGSTPQLPAWGQVRPWLWESGADLRSAAPPLFGSAEFQAALAEVRSIAIARTPEQMRLTEFWADGAGTYTPAGHWNAIASDLIRDAGMSELLAARTLAVMNVAVMDAVIGCWDTKFTYWLVRPWQADPTISTPIGQPPHPSYPSGHACMSGAAAQVLASAFPGKAAELERMAVEACDSRVYAGIHYRFDAEAGMEIGVRAAERSLERVDQLVRSDVARRVGTDIHSTE